MNIIIVDKDCYDAFSTMIPKEYLEGELLILGAVEEDLILGILAAQNLEGRALNLAYIYTEPSRRSSGVAGMLLEALVDLRDSYMPEAPIMALYNDSMPSEAHLSALLIKKGFDIDSEETKVFVLGVNELQNSPLVTAHGDVSVIKGACTLEDIKGDERKKLVRAMKSWERVLTAPDAEDLDTADQKLSSVLFDKEGNPLAIILVDDEDDGDYVISYIYLSQEFHARAISFFKSTLANIAINIEYLHSISFACVNPMVEAPARAIFGRGIEPYTLHISNAVLAGKREEKNHAE